MHVLVTGGAGYIGSMTCKRLAQRGHIPIAYDNLVHGHRWAVRWGPWVEGDLIDTQRLIHTLREYRVDAVVHFAAFAYVGESVHRPDMYYDNNVAGTLSLLKAMRAWGIKNLVFSSTCATYGHPVRLPISEDHPQHPVSPYGASKLMVERILTDFKHAFGLQSISLRYFNAAGADPEGELGEDHAPETHLVPLALAAAGNPSRRLTLFGHDYKTPDGTCIRDYIHVCDLADAHVIALEKLCAEAPVAPAYNLGNGVGFSVRQVMEMAERITGRRVAHAIGPRRAGDPAVLIADSHRAQRDLGWAPRYPALSSIVETAWTWHNHASQGSKTFV